MIGLWKRGRALSRCIETAFGPTSWSNRNADWAAAAGSLQSNGQQCPDAPLRGKPENAAGTAKKLGTVAFNGPLAVEPMIRNGKKRESRE